MSDSQLHLQYANQSMQYTTQFIASISDTEVILDCGSVVVPGSQVGERQLPIHTRMALPWSAVDRLHQLLGELIQSRQTSLQENDARPRASLPPLSHDDPSADSQSLPSQPISS